MRKIILNLKKYRKCYLNEVIILFFFFIFGIVIFILGIAVHTSRIEIKIENLVINTEMPRGKRFSEQSKVYVYLLIFGKIKLFKKEIKEIKRNKNFKFKMFNKNIDMKIDYKELLKNIDIDIKEFDLYMEISTENAAFTAVTVGIISGLLGCIVRKPKYQIIPMYLNKNSLKVRFSGIISVYLMQYIYKLIWDKRGRFHFCPKNGGNSMSEHPIESLMMTAMSSIQDMVDVNTIIGEPIETQAGITIIPISKVSFGFAAGGSEFSGETLKEYNKKDKDEEIEYKLPFGGGAGAGVSINPVAFLVVQEENVKLMPVDHDSCFDRLLDYVPDLMQKINEMFNKSIKQKEDKTKRIIKEMHNKGCYKDECKSQEVKEQEEKIAENERKMNYQEVSEHLEADGEIFE